MIFRVFLALLAFTTLAPASAVAQTLDREAQRELVSRLEVALRQNYVFPDRIPAISAELDRRVQSGPIDSEAFARAGQGERRSAFLGGFRSRRGRR